ncbi:hypothetical protein ASE75_02010 [Sphingomonas sp. Leaf17]|uniref:hypothetical protein n=1 Tax=Sphingomonas sp. Leaf17 TaxID=1735683 RepID=UPI0006F6A6C6|nr:hypothetical protein [Sphingomonas sp. Leaf17]KQM67717.1 hypothetical protein ASE75_02010 [Sphingomonas sp. Leaf17]
MVPRVLIDTADLPGGGSLRLIQRGAEFSIMLGANELMNSRVRGSEEALATMAIDRMPARSDPAMLIGGLGMGFTLRAALAGLGQGAAVTVAELVPQVVDWGRGPMAAVFAGCLDDPRVAIRVEDVRATIAASALAYDAILLDVDNGPDGLTQTANNRLYGLAGLAAARRALRPGGVLAIWSAGADAAFTRRLGDAGFAVEEVVVRSSGKGTGQRHILWFATKPE